MLIQEVSLRNIRSYEDFRIAFDEGITLLSGDIGSGKSSILQGIEFALFGIQRGALEGESLLRHGADEGAVSVTFTIGEREITVRRTLRKTGQGIRQSDGQLTINGVVENLSASELKARVLQLFGYPEALLTKSKGLIFRHTVYTQQEEMKHIIFMPAEERLNTLRTLFGIEKYRIIKENSQLLLREMRGQERQLLLSASQAPALEREHELAVAEAAKTKDSVTLAEAASKAATTKLQHVREAATTARQAWERSLAEDNRRINLQQRIRELERSIRNSREDVERIEKYLVVPLERVEDLTKKIDSTRLQLDDTGEQLLSITRELSELRGKQAFLREQEKRITSLDECPVCKQHVGADHKQHVHQESSGTIKELEEKAAALSSREQQLRRERQRLQEEMNGLHEHQKRYARYQREVLDRMEQQKNKERLEKRRDDLQKELAQAQQTLVELPPPDPAVKAAYDEAQRSIAQAEAVLHERLEALSAARAEDGSKQAQLALLADRLSQARTAQKQAAQLQGLRQFIEEHFMELVGTIERHVLASIHAEFRDLFQKWFNRLVEDETISVSLGEQFEPLVTQNGYDASLEQLSGGEKTAVALSYRLSLYRVVSDFIATITTKDLLILDEPTDGFSSEQLVRVRDVLRELGCRQIILVSHETQMEGSSDQVVRLKKTMHRSSLA